MKQLEYIDDIKLTYTIEERMWIRELVPANRRHIYQLPCLYILHLAYSYTVEVILS